jgi:hypothetical protein
MTVRHLGPPADAAAHALLGSALSERLSARVAVRTRAYPADPVQAPVAAGAAWLPGLVQALEVVDDTRAVNVCVALPRGGEDAVARRVRAEASRHPAGRVHLREGAAGWEYRLTREPCEPPAPPPDSTVSAPR